MMIIKLILSTWNLLIIVRKWGTRRDLRRRLVLVIQKQTARKEILSIRRPRPLPLDRSQSPVVHRKASLRLFQEKA